MAITATITGGDVQLTGNPVYINCTGGSAPVDSSGYKILLKVISQDQKLEGSPFIDAIAPDSTGKATFDISGYVDQPVKAIFQYPLVGAYKAYPTQAFNIQIQTGERYFDDQGILKQEWGTVNPTIIQMLKGGLSPRQIAMMNADSSNFFNTYVQGDKWLTARPQGDEVHPKQNVKLWYMVASNTSATFKVKIFYDDSTTATKNTTVVGGMNKDNLYEFNCNPTHLGLDLEPTGKRATHFEVSLDFGGSTSHVRNFYFDWRPCERPFFLFFANSLGGVDDVFFSGFGKDKFVTSGEISAYPPQPSNTVYDPTLIPSGKTGQNTWELNTGWKGLTTLQYYRDLMLAKQAWYLYSNVSITSYIPIPVLIDNGDQIIFDRKENRFNFPLSISEAHKSEYPFDNRLY